MRLSPVRLEIIRMYFASSIRAEHAHLFLQLIDAKRVRIEVFSSFKQEVRMAGDILTQWLNNPNYIMEARQSLKLQGKPRR